MIDVNKLSKEDYEVLVRDRAFAVYRESCKHFKYMIDELLPEINRIVNNDIDNVNPATLESTFEILKAIYADFHKYIKTLEVEDIRQYMERFNGDN